jgi:hypothetical protein
MSRDDDDYRSAPFAELYIHLNLAQTQSEASFSPPVAVGERWPVVRTGRIQQTVPRVTRDLVYRRDERTCLLCGTRHGPLQLDHIVPWSAGGPDTSENLRVACQDCNQARSNYRNWSDWPMLPVTALCDACIYRNARCYGVVRYGRVDRYAPATRAFCGHCARIETVTEPSRLL